LDLPKAEFLHRLPIHNGDSRRQRVAFDADVDEETGEINLTWDAVDSATGYTIYCDTEGGGRVPLTTVTTTAYTVSDYAFDTLSVAVIPGDDAVEFDAEVDGETGDIALTWDASETAMGYTIYHDTGSGALEYLDSVTGLSYTVSGSLDYTAESLHVTQIRSASAVEFDADVDEQTGRRRAEGTSEHPRLAVSGFGAHGYHRCRPERDQETSRLAGSNPFRHQDHGCWP
jgi:hypothetical protein